MTLAGQGGNPSPSADIIGAARIAPAQRGAVQAAGSSCRPPPSSHPRGASNAGNRHRRPTGPAGPRRRRPHRRRPAGALYRRPVRPAAPPRPHTQEGRPMAETVPAAAQDLRGLAVAALTAAGAQPRHAEWTADILGEGDLMGLGTHGVLRLLLYCERLRLAGIKGAADIAVERKAPSLALVDGDNALGPAVAMSALEAAFAMVAETGIAYVGCRNSNHLGALAPYGLKACERGYVLIAGPNASTTIAPWGGQIGRASGREKE